MNVLPFSFQLIEVSVETLEFSEEVCFWKIRIENAHVVMLVESGYQIVTSFLNGPHVTGRYISGGSYQRKVLHAVFVTFPFSNLYHSLLSGHAALPVLSKESLCPNSLIHPPCRAGLPITSS